MSVPDSNSSSPDLQTAIVGSNQMARCQADAISRVAVGARSDRLGTVDWDFAARVLAWLVDHFEEASKAINLPSPTLREKRELAADLKQINPALRVIWLPRWVLSLISGWSIQAQRLLRRGRVPVDLAKIFAEEIYDTATIRHLAKQMHTSDADRSEA